MLPYAAKNLVPKFNPNSKIPIVVKDIIKDVLKNPVSIRNQFNKSSNNNFIKQVSAYNNKKHVCLYEHTEEKALDNYFENFKENKILWERTPFSRKREIFLKAADLIEYKYYNQMLAYTIVGQNKNIYEAEIDAICELADFLRFNVQYAEEIITKQPLNSLSFDHTNNSEYNSLNGYVASITPFNFTAIGANLASAPLLFGNSVLWKPSDSSILSNYLFYEIMLEAGLPEGVLNFCPMEPEKFLNVIKKPELASILFTGCSEVLEDIFIDIYKDIRKFNNFPRIVGESGGKNFHFIDKDIGDLEYVVDKTIESSFNYSGQKCSACSIAYVQEDHLQQFIELLNNKLNLYIENMENYGVINENAYSKLDNIVNVLKNDKNVEFIFEGQNNDQKGYFIHPHVLICRDHEHDVFNKEFFGPILAIYPYNDLEETVEKLVVSNRYALTGAVFSDNVNVIDNLSFKLRHKAGNFYINDKSTGSIVGQQPFGGSGKSGTNDKAGDLNLLYKLFNQRNIKKGKF